MRMCTFKHTNWVHLELLLRKELLRRKSSEIIPRST
jgi:hypothetical protein